MKTIDHTSSADEAHAAHQQEKLVNKAQTSCVPGSEFSNTDSLNAAHTPTPWHVGYGYIWGPEMEMIGDSEDEEAYVLRMRGVGGNLPIAANHAFIVHACNSYEALLAERDKLLQVLETRAEREREMLAGVAEENDALKEEVTRLQKDLLDLDHDFKSTLRHCDDHHIEGQEL